MNRLAARFMRALRRAGTPAQIYAARTLDGSGQGSGAQPGEPVCVYSGPVFISQGAPGRSIPDGVAQGLPTGTLMIPHAALCRVDLGAEWWVLVNGERLEPAAKPVDVEMQQVYWEVNFRGERR
jgi:hypothetical protein